MNLIKQLRKSDGSLDVKLKKDFYIYCAREGVSGISYGVNQKDYDLSLIDDNYTRIKVLRGESGLTWREIAQKMGFKYILCQGSYCEYYVPAGSTLTVNILNESWNDEEALDKEVWIELHYRDIIIETKYKQIKDYLE